MPTTAAQNLTFPQKHPTLFKFIAALMTLFLIGQLPRQLQSLKAILLSIPQTNLSNTYVLTGLFFEFVNFALSIWFIYCIINIFRNNFHKSVIAGILTFIFYLPIIITASIFIAWAVST